MKKLLWLIAVLFTGASAFAQYTTVSGIIRDTNGTVYQNCHYSVIFRPQSLDPGPYLLSGSVFQQTFDGATCDSFGAFSIRIPSNDAITPQPSQWEFDICDQTGKYCFHYTATITGDTMDISAPLQVAAAILPRIANSLPAAGTGTNVVTTNLPSGGTPGICAEWGTGGVLGNAASAVPCGTGGGGGSGNVTTTPGAGISQDVVQQTGSQFSANNFNGIRYLVPDYNWTRSPSTPSSLATGANTITLAPCPRGLSTNDHYVYIAGTGTPEAVKITAVSCAGGVASGTITVTTAGNHSAGYTVQTASGGIKEASEDAKFAPTNPSGTAQEGVVIGRPGYEAHVFAQINIEATGQKLDLSGMVVECNVVSSAGDCLKTGDDTNSADFTNIWIRGLRLRAMVPSAGGFASNANHSTVDYLDTRDSATNAYFTRVVRVLNDTSFTLMHADSTVGTNWGKCDAGTATNCSAFIEGPVSNTGTMWLSESNLDLGCNGNGILWRTGSPLQVANTNFASYAQFAMRVQSTAAFFNGGVILKQSACSNPIYGYSANAGVVQEGGHLASQSSSLQGVIPVFVNNASGATYYSYWAVLHNSALGAKSLPFPIGYSNVNSGTVTSISIKFPGTAFYSNVDTFDILRASGAPGFGSASPNGTGTYAVVIGASIASNCTATVCSFTDTNAALSAYTVSLTASGTYAPDIGFLPGGLVMSSFPDSANYNSGPADYVGTFVAGVVSFMPSNFSTNTSFTGGVPNGIATSLGGPVGPFVPYQPTYGVSGFNNIGNATIVPLTTGQNIAGQKGRINFGSWSGIGSVITFKDAAPDLTMSTFGNRPAASSGDWMVGADTNGLAWNATGGHSRYIGALLDNASWTERLTASAEQFKVPVDILTGLYAISGPTVSTPAALPATNFMKGYFRAGQGFCALDSAGTEYCPGAGGGGSASVINNITEMSVTLSPAATPNFTFSWVAPATPTSLATPGAIVKRDGSGDIIVNNARVAGLIFTGPGPFGVESVRAAATAPSAGNLSKVGFDSDGKLYVWESDGATSTKTEVAKVNSLITGFTGILGVAHGGTGISDFALSGAAHRVASVGFGSPPASQKCVEMDTAGNLQIAASNTACATAGVSSVFGRSGAVVAVAADYTLDLIGDPAATRSFNFTTFSLTKTWGNITGGASDTETYGALTGTPAVSQKVVQDTTGNTNTGPLADFHSVGTSTALPLQVTAQGTANGAQMDTTGRLKPIGSGKIAANVDAGGVSAKTTNFTAAITDCGTEFTVSNAGAQTATLPASSATVGCWLEFQNIGAGTWTISRNGHTIDGAAADISITATQGVKVKSDGTNWVTQRGIGSASGGGGGGGGGTQNYGVTFSAQTTVTVTGATHLLATKNLIVNCFDNAAPAAILLPQKVTVDGSTFDVVITFAVSATGYCVINGSAFPRFATTFSNQTSVTVTGATHGLGTADLRVTIWDSASGTRRWVEPQSVAVDSTTFDVTVTFAASQSGRLVIQ